MGKKKKSYDIGEHVLVPKHIKLSEKEKDEVLSQYKITLEDLPRISMSDPTLAHLNVTTKDVIKIIRPSKIAGETVFYRRVVK